MSFLAKPLVAGFVPESLSFFAKFPRKFRNTNCWAESGPLFPFPFPFFFSLPNVDTSAYDGWVFIFKGLGSNFALI